MSNLSVQSSSQIDLIKIIDSNKDGKLQPGSEIKMSAVQRAAIDTDQNGELSTHEMSSALAEDRVTINYTGIGPAEIKLNATLSLTPQSNAGMVKHLDTNGDNTLQGTEVHMIPEQIKFMDSDKNGSLSQSEVLNALNSGQAVIEEAVNGDPTLRLNTTDYKTSTYDPARGHISLGGLAGGALGAGVGAIVGSRLGLPVSQSAGTGALIGAIAGTVSGGVYTSLRGESSLRVSELSGRDKINADPNVTKKYMGVGMGIGAVAGAAVGWAVFGRTGLMGNKTAMFAGASALATLGGGIGNGIGVRVSKNQQEKAAANQ